MMATVEQNKQEEQHPLAAARRERNLSYRVAAGWLGISHRHLERLERGQSIPHPTTAARIQRFFPEHFSNAREVRERFEEWKNNNRETHFDDAPDGEAPHGD